MDISLDDVIKQQRNKTKKTGATAGGARNSKLKKLGARSGVVRKPNTRQLPTAYNGQQQRKEPTTLHVSNLDFGVSDADIRELFAECGFIKKAAVHYDKSGRSLGTAEVVFANKEAAVRAIQKYNKVPLDGRPLKLALVPSSTAPMKAAQPKNRLGMRQGGGVSKRTSINKNRDGAGKGRTQGKGNGSFQRHQRQAKKSVTAEQLDADLEAYTRNA